ncbi:hypothetical protein QMN58_25205, partial [Escherichia coli]|nr:hypothetical protein [Escherichia coli]
MTKFIECVYAMMLRQFQDVSAPDECAGRRVRTAEIAAIDEHNRLGSRALIVISGLFAIEVDIAWR